MHIFWECNVNIFGKRHDLKIKVLETPLDITPIQNHFGTELDRTLDPMSVKKIGLISYIAMESAKASNI